jgi:hypothetical protein
MAEVVGGLAGAQAWNEGGDGVTKASNGVSALFRRNSDPVSIKADDGVSRHACIHPGNDGNRAVS